MNDATNKVVMHRFAAHTNVSIYIQHFHSTKHESEIYRVYANGKHVYRRLSKNKEDRRQRKKNMFK